MKSHFSYSLRAKKWRYPLFGAALLLVVGSASAGLSGCGGAASKNGFFNQNTGFYTSANQPVGNGVAHTFLDLKNGIPLRQGLELTPGALENLPNLPPDAVAAPFIGPMPTVTNGSPFSYAVLAFADSHPATNEPEHFHLAMLIRTLVVTEEPFTSERAPVAANEVPPGIARSTSAAEPDGIVVGGGGVIYDDPTLPAGTPPATTLGQNFLYFEGHMNAIVLGPTIAQLKSKQTFTAPIAQPQVYPRDGYYPRRWTIKFDATRQLHIFELSDFIRAPRFTPPGT